MRDVLIIGGGPAGLTAAIYAVRAGLDALILEAGQLGGQVAVSAEVDNYPAVPHTMGWVLANSMAQQVQAEAYALTDELHKLQKDDKQSAAQRAARAREIARKDSERLFAKSDVAHNPVREFVPLKEVRVGQEVVIAEYDQAATVMSLPDRNGMVEVRAGIIKTKVPLSGLKAPDKLQKEKKKNARPAPAPRSATVQRVERGASMEINLLGMSVEEALMEVDQFIDHAVMNGQTMVYLIHGKGTGALRNAIHQHLRGHKNVKSFRLGRYGEGEAGVTVVELK